MALILFKPRRSSKEILGTKSNFTEAFTEFKTSNYCANSQAEQILSNIQQYYVGKRRAKEIRDKYNANDPENDTNSTMEDDENVADDGDLDISSRNHPINSKYELWPDF